MGKKKEALRKIDQKTTNTGAPLPLIQEVQPAPPAFYLIPAPDTLVLLGQAILRSTQAPLVAVAISWNEAPNIAPDYYNVEWSESSSFTDVQRKRASTTSATIDGLKANGVTYYFRVQAVLGGIYSPFSETLTVVTMTDTTPAPIVTGASAVFINGDLFISWTNPASEIFKDVEIKIYNAAHTILYATLHTAAQQITWTANDNLNASSNVGITSVSIDIFSRSWGNTLSAAVNTTATSSAPSTPSPIFSWTGDTGLASADLLVTWSKLVDADSYDLVFDGVPYKTANISYLYRYEQNVNNHRPTLPSGDASITVTLGARNKLNQVSALASGTAINVAPPSGVMSLTTIPGFSMIAATVSLLANTIIQDFDHWEWALASGSTTVQSFISQDPSVKFLLSGSGTYGVSVKAVDKFNQKSGAVTTSGIVMDVLTIGQLRAETTYLDSLGATSPVLDFYKDGIGSPSGTNKIYSAVASGTYQWIEAQRPLLDRYKQITFDGTYAGATLSYLSFNDGNTTTYYAGPITTGGAGEKILTKYTTEANAKTNRFRLDLLGITRIDLPNIQEARTIRIYFSNYIGNLTAYEYYPRRLVQSDDIEAESIRSINVAAQGINADRIFAVTLSAITANIGGLVIDTTGYLWQGTGTPASPTTGLKIFNSGGVGKLSTYNTGVEQITLDTDGKFKAGAGIVAMDANGIIIEAPASASYNVVSAIKWYNTANSADVGRVYGWYDNVSNFNHLNVEALRSGTTRPGNMLLYTNGWFATSSSASIEIFGGTAAIAPYIKLTAKSETYYDLTVGSVSGALYVGQGTYNISWDNANTRYVLNTSFYATGNIVSGADIYWGTGANWLSAYLNQAVLTSSNVTFNTFSVAGGAINNSSSPRLTINTTSGSNARSELYLSKNSAGGWLLGTDLNGNNTNDLFFYDAANSQARLDIGPGGNVQIQQKLYIGAIGTTPTALIHLNTDSALKPTTTTWQTTSTKQAKDNIKTRNGALDRIKQLRLADFDYNGKYHTTKGAKGVGFVAEEAQLIYPNTVEPMIYTNEDGAEETYLAMNPHEIFMDYAPAIQELLARIEALEKK